MLDSVIRTLAHVLTPLFFAGMLGSTILVVSRLGADVIEFFEDDDVEQPAQSRR